MYAGASWAHNIWSQGLTISTVSDIYLSGFTTSPFSAST